MLKKCKALGMIIGVVFLFTAILIPPASAISWGSIQAEPNYGTYWLGRYETGQVTLTIEYVPYFIAYFPLWVEIQVTKSPTWLTVTPSPSTFALQRQTSARVQILLAVNTHDIEAGETGNVELYITGRIILGGQLRTIDPQRVPILVGYNPFTEVTIQVTKPIERTAPDKELTFPMRVINWGNTPTTVTFTVTSGESDWEVVPSQPVKIPPKKPGDSAYPEQTVMLTVTSPHGTAISYHNDWEGFTIEGFARSDAPYYELSGGEWGKIKTDKEGITIYTTYANLLAKNRGFYVPGFDALLLIGVLGALALFMARKRKR